jgi:hypothetical protein
MELGDRTVMLLGGSGLVGHAVALDPYRGGVTIDVEWGNVFTVEEKGARIKR